MDILVILFCVTLVLLGYCFQREINKLNHDLFISKRIGARLAKKLFACKVIISEIKPELDIKQRNLDDFGIYGRALKYWDVESMIDILGDKSLDVDCNTAENNLIELLKKENALLKRLCFDKQKIFNDEYRDLLDEHIRVQTLCTKAFAVYVQAVLQKEKVMRDDD